MIIASQNQMKIFRYKLRNGNFIIVSHKKRHIKHKTHKKHKKHKKDEQRLAVVLVRFVLYVTFVPFCGSFSFCRGAGDVTHATDGLDALETVQLVAQLLTQVTDVHVDAAIKR